MNHFFVAFINMSVERGINQSWTMQKGDIFVATLISLLEHVRSKQRCIIFLTLMMNEGHYKDGWRWRMMWVTSSLKEVVQNGWWCGWSAVWERWFKIENGVDNEQPQSGLYRVRRRVRTKRRMTLGWLRTCLHHWMIPCMPPMLHLHGMITKNG
jgi:hypothetical protein